jgi:hypothetical protein
MNKLTFNIRTVRDFYKKLQEEYEDYYNNNMSSRFALNCAMTSWHMTDWIYGEFYLQLNPTFKSVESYRLEMRKLCPSLRTMHDLSNGIKHYSIDRYTPAVKSTESHLSSFSDDFSDDFDTQDVLFVEYRDGTKVPFESELKKTVQFWQEYLKATFNIVS